MKRITLILALIFSLSGVVLAQEKAVFQTDEGAIKGYDVVAYFKDGKAVKGEEKITYQWNEAIWHFANKENLKAFKANPEKYAPQYGGYCAYGYAQGHAAPTQPDAFKIVDGKLYLNYNLKVQQMWSKDIPGFIIKADGNYQKEHPKKN